MAKQIICTSQEPVGKDHDQAHIVAAGTLLPRETLELEEILQEMDNGETFYTKVNGERAEVHEYQCNCGQTTIRTDPDSSEANNLDNLRDCR